MLARAIRSRRRVSILVALALLCAQQWALGHGFAHLRQAVSPTVAANDGSAGDAALAHVHCLQCLAMAGLGSALAAAPPSLPHCNAQFAPAACQPVLAPARHSRSYLARAPPSSLL